VKVVRQTTIFVLNGTGKPTRERTEQVLLDHWRRAVLHINIPEKACETEVFAQDKVVYEVILSTGNNFSSNSQWTARSVNSRQ
jgi:hypothetical protein